MWRILFVIFLLFRNVFCDGCVIFDFEDSFEDYFTNNYGICVGNAMWYIGEYAALNMEGPHERSTRFITPLPSLSCISSFKFLITSGGRLEVSLFMVPISAWDQISFLLFQSVTGSSDETVGQALLSAADPNFVPGWQTVSMSVNIIGPGRFEGYLTIMGIASTDSKMLIDSFRYISPIFDEELCVLYPEDEIVTEPPTTTEELTETTEPLTTTELTTTTEECTEFTELLTTTEEPTETTEPLTTEGLTSTTEFTTTTEEPNETSEPRTSTEEPTTTTEEQTTTTESSTTIEVPTEIIDPLTTTEQPTATTEFVITTEEPTETPQPSTITEKPTMITEIPTDTEDPNEITELPTTTKDPTNVTEVPTTKEEPTTTSEILTTSTDLLVTNTVTVTDEFAITTDATSIEKTDPTDRPLPNENCNCSFWNALTISMVVTLCLIALILIASCAFYKIGKHHAEEEDPPITYVDIDELPKPILLPRITKFYRNTIRIVSRRNPV